MNEFELSFTLGQEIWGEHNYGTVYIVEDTVDSLIHNTNYEVDKIDICK